MAELHLTPVFSQPAMPAVSGEGSGQTADGGQFNQMLSQIMDKLNKVKPLQSAASSRMTKNPAGKTLSETPAEILEQLQLILSSAAEGEALSAEADGESVSQSDLEAIQAQMALWYAAGLSVQPQPEEALAPEDLSASPGVMGISGEGRTVTLTDQVMQSLSGGDLGGLTENEAMAGTMPAVTGNEAGEAQAAEQISEGRWGRTAGLSPDAVNVQTGQAERVVFGVTVQPLQTLAYQNRMGQGVSSVPVTLESNKGLKPQVSIAPPLRQRPENEEASNADPENAGGTLFFSDAATASEVIPESEAEADFVLSADVKVETPVTVTEAGLDAAFANKAQQPVAAEDIPQRTESSPVTKETVFEQIVEKARIMASNGHGEMELDLKPDYLGKIQLRISMENQLISARFIAESDQVKAILETHLADLKRQLQENGVDVQQLLVFTGNESKDPSLNQNAFSQSRQDQTPTHGRWSVSYEEAELPGEAARQASESLIDLIA